MRSKPRGPKPPVLLPRPPGGDNRTSKPPQGTGPDRAASGPNGGGSRSGVVTREPGGRPSAWSHKASPWLTWSAPSLVPFLHVHDSCPEGQLPPPKFWRNKVKMQLLEDECPFTADKGYSVWDPRGLWDETQNSGTGPAQAELHPDGLTGNRNTCSVTVKGRAMSSCSSWGRPLRRLLRLLGALRRPSGSRVDSGEQAGGAAAQADQEEGEAQRRAAGVGGCPASR